jgi:hydrogenase maturation factor HypE
VLLVDGTVIHKANGDRASSHSYTYAVCVCKGVHRPFVVASVLIVGTDIDLGLTALTATHAAAGNIKLASIMTKKKSPGVPVVSGERSGLSTTLYAGTQHWAA